MKGEIKLNPNLRRLHSVPKTDKGKDKIKENPPFMPALSFASRDDLEETGNRLTTKSPHGKCTRWRKFAQCHVTYVR